MTDKFISDGITIVGHEAINDEDKAILGKIKIPKKPMVHGGPGSGRYPAGSGGNEPSTSSMVPKAEDSITFEPGSSSIFSNRDADEIRDAWSDITKNGIVQGSILDESEKEVCRMYQQNEFQTMNELARTGDIAGYPGMVNETYNNNATMDLAISKGSQPIPSGTEMWRGMGEHNGAIVAAMEVGDICKDAGFQSFSMDPYVGGNFARIYEPSNGEESKDGEPYTLAKTVIRAISSGTEKALGGSFTERELIFPRGTKWQVISKEQFEVGRGVQLNIVTVMHHE